MPRAKTEESYKTGQFCRRNRLLQFRAKLVWRGVDQSSMENRGIFTVHLPWGVSLYAILTQAKPAETQRCSEFIKVLAAANSATIANMISDRNYEP